MGNEFPVFMSGIGVMSLVSLIVGSGSNYIPRNENVQEGYVPPAAIKVECSDLDHNGELETIVKFNDLENPSATPQPYLLKYDSEGRPQLYGYEVVPAKVVSSE
jgi:hypothetical protein